MAKKTLNPNKKAPAVRKTKKREDMINDIIDLKINQGYSQLNILNHLKTTLGLSESYSYELMRNAKDQIDLLTVRAFKDDMNEVISHWETLYQKAVAENNLFVAKDVLDKISKIKGLYLERSVIEHKGEISVIKLTEVKKEE
jgi:hypothetical protein